MLRKISFSFILILGLIGLPLQVVSADSILDKLVTQAEDEFLSPDEAFQLSVNHTAGTSFEAIINVAPGYYLYKSRLQLKAQDAVLTNVTLPAGEIKNDPNFGEQEVYHNQVVATAQYKLNKPNQENISLKIRYQGCSEKGLCYAPVLKTISLPVKEGGVENPSKNNAINSEKVTGKQAPENASQSTALLESGNLWWIVAGFFGAGLLLSLTPCVLPMIPILSSIIVGSQQNQNVKRSPFMLSVAYVLGMALSYTLAGIAAGLSGSLISQSLQNAWVLGATAIVFILLALSMFGFYELKLPTSIESKMLAKSQKLKGGEYLGVLIMGALSALIVSPCVAAPLAGALLYIGQTQNVVLGGLGLFALAIGMGVPLLLIGASAGKALPKAGAWMNIVKHLFGLLMLGMAIWIVTPLLPANIVLLLWAVMSMVTAAYLLHLANNDLENLGTAVISKGLAFLLAIYSAALLVGALSGGVSISQPLQHLVEAGHNAEREVKTIAFSRVSSVQDFDERLAQAKGKPVMLDFYADWCVACKEMEHQTFSDATVQSLLRETVLLQADVTKNTEADKALLKRFGLYGPPGILFFDDEGVQMEKLTTIGFKNAGDFSQLLQLRDQCLKTAQGC